MDPVGTVNGLVIDCADPIALAHFQRVPEPKAVKNRLHLDVEVPSLDDATARVESLRGRALKERGTEFGWHFRVMADPEGNEFCLIEQAVDPDPPRRS